MRRPDVIDLKGYAVQHALWAAGLVWFLGMAVWTVVAGA